MNELLREVTKEFSQNPVEVTGAAASILAIALSFAFKAGRVFWSKTWAMARPGSVQKPELTPKSELLHNTTLGDNSPINMAVGNIVQHYHSPHHTDPAVTAGNLIMSFDRNDDQSVRLESGTPREYRVKVTNNTGRPAHDVYVMIERTVPPLQHHVGVRLRRRHGTRHESSITLPNGESEYFNLLEYNPLDQSINRPVLLICQTADTVPLNVAVDDYTFVLKARSNESSSDLLALRFERLYSHQSQLVIADSNGSPAPRVFPPDSEITPDMRKPFLSVSNGSQLAIPEFTAAVFEGVAVTNIARHMETIAYGIFAKITYRYASGMSFAIDNPSWMIFNGNSYELSQTPSISSMADSTYILPVLFAYSNRKHYAAFFPPATYDRYELMYGDWTILIQLKDRNRNSWEQSLIVRLTNNRPPEWRNF